MIIKILEIFDITKKIRIVWEIISLFNIQAQFLGRKFGFKSNYLEVLNEFRWTNKPNIY